MKDSTKMILANWDYYQMSELTNRLVTALDEKQITQSEYTTYYVKLFARDAETIEFIIDNFEDHTIRI